MGRHGLECDPANIEDVKSWPVPDCLKSVRQFLGFVGYYRRFIPSFADVATPLVTLTGKDVALRAALIEAPILAFPTETGRYVLDTDASNFGLGGVLSQVQNDQERVVAYCSRALRPSQRRYCTTKREMLAAVAMRIQFRSYLRGARFTLRTDHKSLVWLHCFKDTEGMMSRWLHALQQFQFSIVHQPGKDHGNADGLSRAPSSPVDSAPALAAHRPSYYTTIRTNHSTRSRPVALRTLIWCRSSRGKIGLPDWTMICHNRPQSREIHFVFQPFSERTRYASH